MTKHGREVLTALAAGDAEKATKAAKMLWYAGMDKEVCHVVDGHMIVARIDGFRTWEIGA